MGKSPDLQFQQWETGEGRGSIGHVGAGRLRYTHYEFSPSRRTTLRDPNGSQTSVHPSSSIQIMPTKSLVKFIQLLAFLVMFSCASPPLPKSIAREDAKFSLEAAPALLLGTNDTLRVLIPGHPELVNDRGYRVSVSGTIGLPLCGPVLVAGLNLEQAEERINEALGEYLINPVVGLSVVDRDSQKVHLLGQLKRPGIMNLDRPTTALAALASGGGFEFGARRTKVALIRRDAHGGCAVHFFNGETPGPDSLRWVQGGDVLFVPRSGVGVFRDEILPILQGIGFATSQLTAVALAADAL
jgi:polysaccharide biosynthesis/export protein